VRVMQALWAEPHVNFNGRWHTIEDAGINPRPASGRVPVWFGGHHERTLERIAKIGDGWMPNAYSPGREAEEVLAKLRSLTELSGRDPARVGIEVWVAMGSGSEADWAKEARFWKQAGDIGVLGRSSTVLTMAGPQVSPLSTATLLTTWCQQLNP